MTIHYGAGFSILQLFVSFFDARKESNFTESDFSYVSDYLFIVWLLTMECLRNSGAFLGGNYLSWYHVDIKRLASVRSQAEWI